MAGDEGFVESFNCYFFELFIQFVNCEIGKKNIEPHGFRAERIITCASKIFLLAALFLLFATTQNALFHAYKCSRGKFTLPKKSGIVLKKSVAKFTPRLRVKNINLSKHGYEK